MKIPDRLVEIREKNGYTRKRLAEELGKPYATITKYETGEREPGHTYIMEIAKKFGVTTDYILGVSDNFKNIAPSLPDEAMEVARDYDKLDQHGKQITRIVLDAELDRMKSQSGLRIVKTAARSGAYTETLITDDEDRREAEKLNSLPDVDDLL